jgi:hypothetical protein
MGGWLHLPANYRRNLRPVDFDDHAPVTGHCAGWTWQPDVYPYAAERARGLGAKALVDVGCGAARKLLPYADEFKLIGIDRPSIVDQIDGPGEWVGANLETNVVASELSDCGLRSIVSPLREGPDIAGCVLICSDVIEHLVHPEVLVAALAECMDIASTLILSTPDRTRTRGATHRGPSPNRGHVQEWNLDELVAFVTDHGLNVVNATHTRSNDHEPDLATCLIEATA